MTSTDPDRNSVEVQRKKLDLQTTSGGAKAEALYREEFLKWRDKYNSTPGNSKLTNR